MSTFHKVLFQWPHTEPSSGIVTGTFDNWSRSVPLTKTSTGLEATVDIPWGQKIKYKFIVDGQWLILDDQPTEVDPGGYVNNVYTAPPKPITQGQHVEGISTNGKAELAETERADSLSQAAAVTGPVFPPLLSDIPSTVIARDGTSSTLGYVASGLGGVVNNFVGIDPINTGQMKLDSEFNVSASASTVDQDVTASPILPPETSPGHMPSPAASLVPIAIIQVNALENKILTSSSSSNIAEIENPPLSSADVAPASSQKGLGNTSHASVLAPGLHVPETSPFSEPSASTAQAEKSLLVVAEIPSIPHIDQEVPETQEGVLVSQENVPEVTAAPSAQGKLLVVEKEASPKDIVRSSGLVESGDRFETPAISVSLSPALDSEQAIPNGRATPTSTSTSIPSAPSTPVKRSLNPFPTSSPSSSVSGSPSSSKFGTPNSARKKRTSIFGKLKHIFHHDKDKEKGKQ